MFVLYECQRRLFMVPGWLLVVWLLVVWLLVVVHSVHVGQLPSSENDILAMASMVYDRVTTSTTTNATTSTSTTTHFFYDEFRDTVLIDIMNRYSYRPYYFGLNETVAYPLIEMNEWYESRFQYRRTTYDLAETANAEWHTDGVGSLFFPDHIRLYRVLLGLSTTSSVKTCFATGEHVHVTRGKFVVFDFDRDRHRVEVDDSGTRLDDDRRGMEDDRRVMLKLHFLVTSPPPSPSTFFADVPVEWIMRYYVTYLQITRYMIEWGKQKTWSGALIGLFIHQLIVAPYHIVFFFTSFFTVSHVMTRKQPCCFRLWFTMSALISSMVISGVILSYKLEY